jgi:hypothetical protein
MRWDHITERFLAEARAEEIARCDAEDAERTPAQRCYHAVCTLQELRTSQRLNERERRALERVLTLVNQLEAI